MQLMKTKNNIYSIAESSRGKGRLLDSVSGVEHGASTSFIAGIFPLSHLYRRNLLIVDR